MPNSVPLVSSYLWASSPIAHNCAEYLQVAIPVSFSLFSQMSVLHPTHSIYTLYPERPISLVSSSKPSMSTMFWLPELLLHIGHLLLVLLSRSLHIIISSKAGTEALEEMGTHLLSHSLAHTNDQREGTFEFVRGGNEKYFIVKCLAAV